MTKPKSDKNCENLDEQLLAAIEKKDLKKIADLMRLGANPYVLVGKSGQPLLAIFEQQNKKAFTVIVGVISELKSMVIAAEEKEDLTAIETLFDTHPYLLDQQYGENDDSILQLSVRHKKEFLVELLLQKYRINLNKINKEGDNVLHLAAKEGNVDLYRTLIKIDVNYDQLNQSGHKPIYYIATLHPNELKNIKEVLLLTLIVDDSNNTLWHVIAVHNNLLAAQVLRSINLSPVGLNSLGNTPLHIAVKNNHTDLIKILLTCKFDINRVNESHETSLQLAIALQQWEIFVLLLEHGADPNFKDKKGKNVLHFAIENGLPIQTIDLILKKGILVNSCDINGNTALHFAMFQRNNFSKNDNKEIIKFLLENGADPNKKNNDGQSALELVKPDEILVKKIFENDRKLLEEQLREANSDYNVIKEFMIQYTFINNKHILNLLAKILPGYTELNSNFDKLLREDIRDFLHEIFSFLKNPVFAPDPTTTSTPTMFKPKVTTESKATSELLTWFGNNKENLARTLDSRNEMRILLSKELYREIILLASLVIKLNPKDQVAKEVLAIYQKNLACLDEKTKIDKKINIK